MTSFKSKLMRTTRLRVVLLLLVMIMTTFVVSKSAKAATQLSSVTCVAAGHVTYSFALGETPGEPEQDDSSDFGDSLVDLEDLFPAQFHFAFDFSAKQTYPRVDLTLVLPPNSFGDEEPPELA